VLGKIPELVEEIHDARSPAKVRPEAKPSDDSLKAERDLGRQAEVNQEVESEEVLTEQGKLQTVKNGQLVKIGSVPEQHR